MHRIAILALDGVIPFDLSTPIEVFSRLRLPDGRAAYQVVVCAATAEVDAGAFTLRPAASTSACIWSAATTARRRRPTPPGCR